jgi:hypothetical protein
MEDNNITASQALALAAGPTALAALNSAKMIRRTPEGLKDTPLHLKKVQYAKVPDIARHTASSGRHHLCCRRQDEGSI